MAYELSGKVKLLLEPKTFNSGLSQRELIVTVEDGRYPQDICIEFVQDKMGLLDSLEPEQEVKVTFDIRGREYNGRYFNNLQGWRIEMIENKAESTKQEFYPPDGGIDDIPF